MTQILRSPGITESSLSTLCMEKETDEQMWKHIMFRPAHRGKRISSDKELFHHNPKSPIPSGVFPDKLSVRILAQGTYIYCIYYILYIQYVSYISLELEGSSSSTGASSGSASRKSTVIYEDSIPKR